MLEDVQERLVYRTHIYIRSEILHYAPAQGDLAYPEKLHMMEVQIKIYIDNFASKPDKSFFSETDFIAGIDRYNHSAECVKISYK